MNNHDPNGKISKTNQVKPEGGFIGVLRTVALIALLVGTVGSLVFMFRAGQHTPRLLLILFIFWVSAPFAALFWANMVSKSWSVLTRTTLYCVELIVAFGSLAIYGEWIDLRPAGSANAALFVAVPPASLIFIAIIVGIAALISNRFSHGGDRH
jgi:hypothetical protein